MDGCSDLNISDNGDVWRHCERPLEERGHFGTGGRLDVLLLRQFLVASAKQGALDGAREQHCGIAFDLHSHHLPNARDLRSHVGPKPRFTGIRRQKCQFGFQFAGRDFTLQPEGAGRRYEGHIDGVPGTLLPRIEIRIRHVLSAADGKQRRRPNGMNQIFRDP